MTAIPPATITYYGITPQCGNRKLAEENLDFFSGPGSSSFNRVLGIINGTPSFARTDTRYGDTQIFATKNVIFACCKAQAATEPPPGASTLVEFLFDNYDFAQSVRVHNTRQIVSNMVQTALNEQSVLTLSDGYSKTIVAKVSRIADVIVHSTE